MDRWPLLLIAVVAGVWLAILAWRLRAEGIRVRTGRAGLFDAVRPLLFDPRLRVEPSGFPRLAGRFEGCAVDLQAVPDALSFRKLPALWLLATLTGPQPIHGETRVMRRPTGHEPFSTFSELPEEAAPPSGFPEDAVVRTTSRAHLPSPAVFAALGPLFADPAVKEIVLAATGLRLVRLAEEAPRGGYLLFRDSDVGRAPVAPETAQAMLGALLALSGTLAESADARLRRA